MPLVHICGFLYAAHALFFVRSPQGTIAWALLLAFIPWIGIPLYWVFGRQKFHGYISRLREGGLDRDPGGVGVRQKIFAKLRGHRRDHREPVLEKLAGLPFSGGNKISLLIDGEATFSGIYKAIDEATETIVVSYFILRRDSTGDALTDRLCAASARGVKVRLLYDRIGSRPRPRPQLRRLREAGAEVARFRTSGLLHGLQVNFRNHRKMVVVDGHKAFVGGHNVGDEYMGLSKRFGHWRDTHVCVHGPAALGVQLCWLQDWYWSTGECPDLPWDAEERGESDAIAVATGPADEQPRCTLFLLEMIERAQTRLWITTPYFVPDAVITYALRHAALRGVDVRVLLPSIVDHYSSHLAGLVALHEMRDSGVRFFRFGPGFMHQKCILVDDDLCSIGTVNFDNRSIRLHFEISVVSTDPAFCSEVEAMLAKDFGASVEGATDEYAQRALPVRLAARAMHLAAPAL